jgi:hypothetical protein
MRPLFQKYLTEEATQTGASAFGCPSNRKAAVVEKKTYTWGHMAKRPTVSIDFARIDSSGGLYIRTSI